MPLTGDQFEMPPAAPELRLRLEPPTQRPLPLHAAVRIRRATTRDLSDCVRMAVRFWQESPYRELAHVSVGHLEILIGFLLDHGGAYVAQLDGEMNDVVGMIGASISPNVISGELTACESCWWLEPEHRHGSTGLRLLEAIETWAKAHGAVRFQMIAPVGDERIRGLYRRRGYVEVETVFQSELRTL